MTDKVFVIFDGDAMSTDSHRESAHIDLDCTECGETDRVVREGDGRWLCAGCQTQ